MTIRLCVAAVVLNPTGHILLVRNLKRNAAANAPVWELPGGGMDHDEGILHAASREVFEETRCDIYGARLEDTILGTAKPGAKYRSVIFVVHAAGEGAVFASGDAIEAAWFKKDDLPRLADLDSARVIAGWADMPIYVDKSVCPDCNGSGRHTYSTSSGDFEASCKCQGWEALMSDLVVALNTEHERDRHIDALKAQLKSREDRLDVIDRVLGRVSNLTTEARASYVMNELAQALKEIDRLTVADAATAKYIDSMQAERDALRQRIDEIIQACGYTSSIPLLLHCPLCNTRHIDAGEYATKPHHTHACQSCGHCWRPAVGNTVGVQFLPGFKDEPELSFAERVSAPKFAGFVGAEEKRDGVCEDPSCMCHWRQAGHNV